MVAGTRGLIPSTPEARFAEWQNVMEYRVKAVETGPTDKKAALTRLRLDTTNSHTATGTTDFVLTPTVEDTRLYEVWLDSQWNISATGSWVINMHVGGTLYDRFDFLPVGVATRSRLTRCILWTPPTTGTFTVDVRVVEDAGASQLDFEAATGNLRRFWIKDIGLR